MLSKKKVHIVSLLFLLAILQYLNVGIFWGIDFLFLGLLLLGYFVQTPMLLACAAIFIISNSLIEGAAGAALYPHVSHRWKAPSF